MPKPSRKNADATPHDAVVPAISVKGCTVSFGGSVVLHDVGFEVTQGEISAIIGPNGSGKTTLLKTILGLVQAKSGEIRIFGKHLHAVRDMIGYVPQRFDFDRDFPLSVGEFMDLARHPHCPKSRIAEKIREVGLPRKTLDVRIGDLSGGQMQRVLIAQAILNNPQLLFLDEPSSGIDIAGEATFYELIQHLNREHDTTIVLVSHDIALIADMVDNVICVNKKLLCYGPPHQALTAHKIAELFGEQKLFDHPGHDDRHEHKPGETHDHGH